MFEEKIYAFLVANLPICEGRVYAAALVTGKDTEPTLPAAYYTILGGSDVLTSGDTRHTERRLVQVDLYGDDHAVLSQAMQDFNNAAYAYSDGYIISMVVNYLRDVYDHVVDNIYRKIVGLDCYFNLE